MHTPHKYTEAIKAWADGKPIEFRYISDGLLGKWCPFTYKQDTHPDWAHNGMEWRPAKDIRMYRIYKDEDYNLRIATTVKSNIDNPLWNGTNKKWVTNWTEEIPHDDK